MLRRYAAKIDFELKLHTGPALEGKEELYARTLGAATLVEYPPVSFLDDVDSFFYCANYLRAWMFQAQLAAHLRKEFGEGWFADPRSGEVLKGLWALGQGEPLDALLQRLGLPGLSAEPLAEAVERGLKN
ncbi:MAG: hypothetical protein ACE5JJ_08590 [Nitrospinota bacterium]